MTSEQERLATSEQQVKAARHDRQRIVSKLEEHDLKFQRADENLNVIREDVHAILVELSSFKGFWRGVVFAMSAIAGVLGAIIVAVWNWVSSFSWN